VVHLHRGVPAAPLPSRALRRLEIRLWAGARPVAGGWLEPDVEARSAFVASQAARPGFSYDRQRWSSHLAESPGRPVMDPSWPIRVWSAARWLQRKVRPRRLATPLKALLAASPVLDRSRARCRFGGVELVVAARVFKPRALTEAVLRAALDDLGDRPGSLVVEIGTGSGAVALALAHARPADEIHAVELFGRAVRSARSNGRRLRADTVEFYQGSLLDPLPAHLRGTVDVLVANLPYVPPARHNGTWEFAPGAIGGTGDDGLGLVRELAAGARRFLRPGGSLILQMTADQWTLFSDELDTLGYRPEGIVAGSGADAVVRARFETRPREVAKR
ncbi:MAG: methyltransferase, partial [Acidimicrobiales bacterium]